MKIGVFTAQPFGDTTLEKAMDYLSNKNVDAVEISVGGYLGSKHLDAEEALENKEKQKEVKELLKKYNLEICGFAAHANPIHPQKEKAKSFDKDLRNAIKLADQMDVDTVITFSGCPGSSENAKYPNWITNPWPPEQREALKWQWEEKIIPYWKDLASHAKKHSVNVAIEMHPNMSVYNPETLLKLRENTNKWIGANFDPSHLYWQWIDPIEAAHELGKENAIKYVHAKDTKIYPQNTRVNGVLDTKSYLEEEERAWTHRTLGYGHDEKHWKDLISALRMEGYDGALSIEHEDTLTSTLEGLEKALDVLNRAIFKEKPGGLDLPE
ncbi:MAG: sugar phosphate isomerase/epimerase family protein [Candidatus Hadarchaeia archaeon]